MRTRFLKYGPMVSDRTALIAVLALCLSALASLPGRAPDADAVAGQAEAATTVVATPAAAPGVTPTATDSTSGKPKFRLLLLRRG